MDTSSYSLKTSQEVLELLKSSLTGLTDQEVLSRRALYGLNTLKEVHHSALYLLFAQFCSPLILLLLAAAVVSAIVGDLVQALLIFSFVLINTFFSFYQEYKSEATLQLLKKHLQLTARVRRNNQERFIDAQELVPGDIILLEPGDFIPAEIRFLQSDGLLVDESIVSGESFPITKSAPACEKKGDEYIASNIGILGTMVISGTGSALVFATGSKTTLGSISNLVLNVIQSNNFSREIKKLSTFILWLVILTLAVVFITHLMIRSYRSDIIELLTFSIALAVAMTPETLPAVITAALANGASKLAANNVIVKRLSAIEDLGNIDILCTDKTGTLTENKLTLSDVYSDNRQQTIEYGCLVATKYVQTAERVNSFDTALFETISADVRTKLAQIPRIYEVPFSPNRLRSSVVVTLDNKSLLIVRGALEPIIDRSISTHLFDAYKNWTHEQEQAGKRVLAVAYKQLNADDDLSLQSQNESELILSGLLSFSDPIKKDTPHAIQEAKKLHIIVKILTGDSPLAAQVVGQQINLITAADTTGVITGASFDQLSPSDQLEAVERYTLFARINPQQKYKIVELLKKKYRVGFLGEGFNDAPALKIADVGLVVKEATDIAREAADIILLGKGLHVIINGIKEGRLVFNNTLKYLQIVLSSNFGNFYSIAIASFFIDYLPMLPLQILLVNLLSDFPMIAIASDSIDISELRKPKRYNLKNLAFFIIIFGLISAPFDFALFLFFKHSPALLQTNWFIESVLTELVIITSLRTRLVFFKAKPMSRSLFALTIISAIAACIIPFTWWGKSVFHFVQPDSNSIIFIACLAVGYLITTELIKHAYYQLMNHTRGAS